MAQPFPQLPQQAQEQRRVRQAVVTFQSCQDPGRAHSFPLVPQPLDPSDGSHSFAHFGTEATMDLLERAGRKLDFRPEDLLAWTADQAMEKPPATRKGDHPQSPFCHCGLESAPQLDCLQTLCNYLEQMVKDQLRRGKPILLHVQRKVVEMPRTEPLEEDGLNNMGEPRRSQSSAHHGGAAATSSCRQLPFSSGPAGRAQKLQKQSPGDLR